MNSALILSQTWIYKNHLLTALNGSKVNKLLTKVTESFRMGWNFDYSTHLIIYTGFPTSCEVKYNIFDKKSINDRFKQPREEVGYHPLILVDIDTHVVVLFTTKV